MLKISSYHTLTAPPNIYLVKESTLQECSFNRILSDSRSGFSIQKTDIYDQETQL